MHKEFVFTYLGRPVGKLHYSAWKRAWERPDCRTRKESEKASGACAVRACRWTRKILLGHANGDITTHYSAAKIEELQQTVQSIVNPRILQAPTLMIMRKTRTGVGKTSAKERDERVMLANPQSDATGRCSCQRSSIRGRSLCRFGARTVQFIIRLPSIRQVVLKRKIHGLAQLNDLRTFRVKWLELSNDVGKGATTRKRSSSSALSPNWLVPQ